GADQVRASSAALPAFEVAVAGRRAALSRLQDVWIHAETHRASRLAPFKPGIQKNAVQSFFFRRVLDRLRARHHHGANLWIHVLPFRHSRRRPQVFDSRIGARSDEHTVHSDAFDRRSGIETHVGERLFRRAPVGLLHEALELGNARVHGHYHSGIRPPGDERRERCRVNLNHAIELRSGIARQSAPVRNRFFPIFSFWSKAPPADIRESRLIGCDQSRSRSRLDAHIAQRHAAFHRQRAHRIAGVLDHMSGGAIGADASDNSERQVLCRHALRQLSAHVDLHRLRFFLRQALRGQHMFHFRCSNAKRQRSERAVRRGVTVAADNRHPRQRDAQFRADDVHNALLRRVHIEERDPELAAIFLQRFNLLRSNRVGDRQAPRSGRDIVVDRCHRAQGLPQTPAIRAQTVESLRRSHFMHQVQIDIEQRRLPFGSSNHVRLPNFLKQSARRHTFSFAHRLRQFKTANSRRGGRCCSIVYQRSGLKVLGPALFSLCTYRQSRVVLTTGSSQASLGLGRGKAPSPHEQLTEAGVSGYDLSSPDRGKHCMINGKRIAVVLPAYNAEKTLEATVRELPDLVDIRILVVDHSSDRTVEVAHQLGLQSFVHNRNYGYGRNQQTCYREALAAGADVVIMVHPDYQYTPLLVTAMASMIAFGVYDVVLGSRILGGQARQGGMPLWKYVANRFLTLFENICLGAKLSEYHTGYRAFSRTVLKELPLLENSDDFVFDNQMLAQCVMFGFRMGEVSCPTKYFPEASSINFRRSVKYGLGVLLTSVQFRLQKMGLARFRIFNRGGRCLEPGIESRYYSPNVGGRSGGEGTTGDGS